MQRIERKIIDWAKTGEKLAFLRGNDLSLRRYACWVCHGEEWECDKQCDTCQEIPAYRRSLGERGLDPSTSCAELAKVFDETESVIRNWETGRTPVPLDALRLYAQISGHGDDLQGFLQEVIVYQ